VLYTSPHLHSVVERIRVGLEPVQRQEFASLVEEAWPAAEWVERAGGHGPVTFFELLTAMAFLHSRRIRADFQVIEVGLGGRLDATNVVSPQVCVITNISLDHTATLGDTLALIAAEKAGIIKRNVPVVVAPQPAEAMEVFLRVSAANEAPMVRVDQRLSWRRRSADLNGQAADVNGLHGRYEVWTSLIGAHQLENAATAIATVETLIDRGFSVSGKSVVEGLRRVSWPARLEGLSFRGRRVVVDGAHNPHSMGRLVEAIREYYRHRRLFLIFGATAGHSLEGMMAQVASLSPEVIAVRSRHPRSVPAYDVGEQARALGLRVQVETDDVAFGVRLAVHLAGEDDLVLGTGSLSVAAEVIEEVRGMTPELYPTLKRPAPSILTP
jgi:dihydrofolate synthase/folylpolyglutamate synthase